MQAKVKTMLVGDCLSLIKNGANIKQDKGASGIPITRIETLSGGVFNRERLGYANITSADKYQDYVLESGDLLFSHINSKTYIGRTVLYEREGNETIIHGMNLLRLRVIPEILIPKFFYYLSLTKSFKNQVAASRKDAVNQSSISVADIKKIRIQVPPIEEQRRIVAELDLLTGIIDKKNAQLSDLDALAQSIFYEMFGDPVTNEKGWPTERLQKVAPKRAYLGVIPSDGEKHWLLNLDMIESQTGEVIDKVFYSQQEIGNSTSTFNQDNVLFSKLRPYLNKVVLPDEPGYCTSELVPLAPVQDSLNRVYLAYLLRSMPFVNYIKGRVAGAKMPRVNMSDFWAFNVILPPLEEQLSFADKARLILENKRIIRNSITDTEVLLNSRMDYYFED